MKESTSRFQDFDLKAKIKFLSEHGQAPIVIGFIGVFFFLTFFGNSVDKMKS